MDTLHYNEAVNDYINTVYKIAFNYCKNVQDAEDVVQNTYLKLLQYKGDFTDDNHLKRWLIRVAINESKNMCTSFWKKRIVPIDEFYEKQEIVFENKEQSELFEAIMNLSEKNRIVVHLYYYEGYSVKEIAGILKIKETAVQNRLMRARESLKHIIKRGE